jgi:hypothetical protein
MSEKEAPNLTHQRPPLPTRPALGFLLVGFTSSRKLSTQRPLPYCINDTTSRMSRKDRIKKMLETREITEIDPTDLFLSNSNSLIMVCCGSS